MPRKSKRLMVIGDLHCGHLIGLTPPSWHDAVPESAGKERKKIADMRARLWDLFSKTVKSYGQIDILVVNGDAIDGRGERSGGCELITPDVDRQCDMAAECIKFIKAPIVHMTYGTPYHTGQKMDHERSVRNMVRDSRYTKECEIHSQAWLEVNGLKMNFRHKPAGSSAVPHSRHTAIAREKLWNTLWSVAGAQPDVDVMVRSHVHYGAFCGTQKHLCMTVPALQGLGSKFGSRACVGNVDWGITIFDIDAKGNYTWLFDIPAEANQMQAAKMIKL